MAVASSVVQAPGDTFFPGHLAQADERNVTGLLCCKVQRDGARLVRSGGAARTKR